MTRSGSRHALAGTLALATFLALATTACDDVPCSGDESFVVDENGTCATTTQRFTIQRSGCGVFLQAPFADTGLPAQGAMGPHPGPLRQGGFLIYGDMPSFRLCRAERIEYRLQLSCVDNDDLPVCQAQLTEPAF